MMPVTVVIEIKAKEGKKSTLGSSVNLSLGLVSAGLGLDSVLREYPYVRKRGRGQPVTVSVVVLVRLGL
jgi:hypothetical protein